MMTKYLAVLNEYEYSNMSAFYSSQVSFEMDESTAVIN